MKLKFILRTTQPLKMGSSCKSPNFKWLNAIWSTAVDETKLPKCLLDWAVWPILRFSFQASGLFKHFF